MLATRASLAVRMAAVLGVPLLCMCAASRRQAKTTLALGGTYAHAENRAYGCLGDVIGTAQHRTQAASLAVEHDTGGYLVGGASLGSASDAVLSTSDFSNSVDRSAATVGAATAWVGMRTNESAVDAGISTFSPAGLFPYAAIRAGNFDRYYGELRLGSRQPTTDGSVLGVFFHNQRHQSRLSVGVGYLAPPLAERHLDETATSGPYAGQRGKTTRLAIPLFTWAIQGRGEYWLTPQFGLACAAQYGVTSQVSISLLLATSPAPAPAPPRAAAP